MSNELVELREQVRTLALLVHQQPAVRVPDVAPLHEQLAELRDSVNALQRRVDESLRHVDDTVHARMEQWQEPLAESIAQPIIEGLFGEVDKLKTAQAQQAATLALESTRTRAAAESAVVGAVELLRNHAFAFASAE